VETLFGIPIDILMWSCAVITLFAIAWSAVIVLRQPLTLRLSIRNIRRRIGRSALIVVGLMLATTIISAAFNTGDTIAETIHSEVIISLGNIDEVISAQEEGDIEITGETTGLAFFDESKFDEINAAAAGNGDIDGVMPAIWEGVGIQNTTTRQTEPRASVFAPDPAHMDGFGTIHDTDGNTVLMSDVSDSEVLINEEMRDELDAEVGHELDVYGPAGAKSVRVKAVIRYDGSGTTSFEPGLMMPLESAQALFQKPGEIEHILISNAGGAVSGAGLTEEVIESLTPALESANLSIEPTKRDDLKEAADQADAFSAFFVTFGSFSIAAGIMLIFLIFVMLAAERKPEMGISRAIGTERRHLVETFTLEGLAYDMFAAAVGAFLGVGVSWAMGSIMSAALSDFGIELERTLNLQSLVTAYVIGVVLTFIVVTFSAWRVSVLNIVTAIRNLPDPAKKTGRASIIWGLLFLALGALMTWAGLQSAQALPFLLGVSLIILAAVPVLRWSRVPDAVAYTVPAIVLLVWWLLPSDALDRWLPEMSADFNIFITSGLVMVTASTWIVMYNSDRLIARVAPVLSRISGVAPVLRTAIAYPLTNRFRTGMTLAMFTLVVFTLVVGVVTTGAFTNAFDDINTYGGGFDMRAETVRINPVDDLRSELASNPDIDEADVEVVAGQSLVAIEGRQANTDNEPAAYPLRGYSREFFDNTTYKLGAIARGYNSPSAVWSAVRDNPNLAVIDSLPVPRRENFSFGAPETDFKVEGFYFDDGVFDPFDVVIRDPVSGAERTVTIIGVLPDTAPWFMIGISVSQDAVDAAFPEQSKPNAHLIALRDGADAAGISDALESQFLANGMQATVLREELDDLVSFNKTFNYVVEGFLGLGLIVGVAALGVISARSVVERRHEIGVMRAIGFESGRVQASFLIEACMVAVVGIVVGTALGLGISFNIIRDTKAEASWENLEYTVPWLALGVIFAIVIAASLLAAYLPARQASRVYPAEALRYE
jgi:putative ABC transport system permease protein